MSKLTRKGGGNQVGKRYRNQYNISYFYDRNPGKTIKYFTTFTNTIYDVLASRGWEEVEADEDVNNISFHTFNILIFS